MNKKNILLWTGIITVSLGVGLAVGFFGGGMMEKPCVCPTSKQAMVSETFRPSWIDLQPEGSNSFLFGEEDKPHMKTKKKET